MKLESNQLAFLELLRAGLWETKASLMQYKKQLAMRLNHTGEAPAFPIINNI